MAVILALGQRQPGAHDGQLQCRQVRGKSQARLHGQSGRCPSLKFRITATGMPGRQNPSQYLMMACSPSIRAHGRTRCQPEAYSQWQRSRCPGHRGPGQASILSVTAAVTITESLRLARTPSIPDGEEAKRGPQATAVQFKLENFSSKLNDPRLIAQAVTRHSAAVPLRTTSSRTVP